MTTSITPIDAEAKLPFTGQSALIASVRAGALTRAVARQLARAGAHVAITDVDERRAAETAGALRDEGLRATGVGMNPRDPDHVSSTVEHVVGTHGSIDLLVNHLEARGPGVLHDIEPTVWDELLAIDLTAAFSLIRSVLPQMLSRGDGRIVNVTPVAPPGGAPDGAFAVAMAALRSLTRTVAMEGGPHGVRCNVVAPACVSPSRPRTDADSSVIEHIPLRRYGTPEDVASVVEFLLSDRSSYITGEVISVSGGAVML